MHADAHERADGGRTPGGVVGAGRTIRVQLGVSMSGKAMQTTSLNAAVHSGIRLLFAGDKRTSVAIAYKIIAEI